MDELKKSLKDFLRIKNYSKHTISNYERDINRFLQYLETKKIDSNDINTSIIIGWIISLRKNGLGNRSIQRNISSLKNFYKFLYKSGAIDTNHFESVQSPKIGETLPKALTPEDVEKLLSLFCEIGSILNSTAFCRDKFFCVIKSFRASTAVIIFVVFLAFQAKFTFAAVLPWLSGYRKVTWVISPTLDSTPSDWPIILRSIFILWRRFVTHLVVDAILWLSSSGAYSGAELSI